MDAEFELGIIILQYIYIIDGYFASGGFKIFALPGEFVGALTVDFYGTKPRDCLIYISNKIVDCLFDLINIRDIIINLFYLSFGVAGGGGEAEFQGGVVDFVEF